MATPELGLAVYGALCDTGRVLNSIVKKINEVQDNRAQMRCNKLKYEVELLRTLLQDRDATDRSFGIIQEAVSCINEIESYVERMKDSSLLNDTMEVWWTRRYIDISNKVERVKELFAIKSPGKLDFNLFGRLDFTSGPHLTLQIPESDIHIQLSNPSIGVTTRGPYKDLVLYKLQDSKLSQESLKVYPRLQERAYVQQLKGITEINGQLYVAMEDCNKYNTVNHLCKTKQLPNELVSRVEIAFKVAQTVAWYHRSDMILKAIYDSTICIRSIDGEKNTPVLTGLDHMRNLYEKTTTMRFDCRYEAPEYNVTRHHTTYSDIWSLGIVIWQIICCKLPYGLLDFVDSDDKDPQNLDISGVPRLLRTRILTSINSGSDPGDFSNDIPQYLTRELKQCWNRDPLTRPNAMQVTKLLQGAWLRLSGDQNRAGVHRRDSFEGLNQFSPDNDSLKKAKAEALSLIHAARKHHSNDELGNLADELSLHSVQSIIDGVKAYDPECMFLVGAIVWWKLLNPETYPLVVDLEPPRGQEMDTDRERAEVALIFLQKAEQGGYKHCYLEMRKAHSQLAKHYKAQYERFRSELEHLIICK